MEVSGYGNMVQKMDIAATLEIKNKSRAPVTLRQSYFAAISIVCILSMNFTSCKDESNTYTKTIPYSDGAYTIRVPGCSKGTLTIQNASNENAELYITPTKLDLYNDSSIVRGIMNDTLSEKQKCFALWKFVADWTYHQRPLSESNNQQSEPAILLNAFEYGYCDDRNTALAKLATIAGIKSRIYNLNGHVVAEMFYNNNWHMFDSDKKLIYLNADKEVADIEYLTTHTEVIDQKNNELEFFFDRYRNRKTKEALLTTSDNFISTSHLNPTENYNSGILLRSGDILEMSCEQVNFLKKWFWIDVVRKNGPLYNNEGLLSQRVELSKPISGSRDYYYASDTLPYPITKMTIECKESYRIYYSCDNQNWHYKGQSGKRHSSITFTPRNSINDPYVFYYFLKLVPEKVGKRKNVKIFNHFIFSDKGMINNPENSFQIVPLNEACKKLIVKFDSK